MKGGLAFVLVGARALVAEEFTGYVVDNYCWDKPNHQGIDGALLGTAPETHVLHCLTWTPCIPGGYTMLEALSEPADDGSTYMSKYQFDDNGDKLVVMWVNKEMMRAGDDADFDEKWTATGTLDADGVTIAVTKLCLTPRRQNEAGETLCLGMTDMPDSPADADCEGTWSECTAACETSMMRMFTMTQAKSGNGQDCPTAADCEDGDGLCESTVNTTAAGTSTPASGNSTTAAGTTTTTVATETSGAYGPSLTTPIYMLAAFIYSIMQ